MPSEPGGERPQPIESLTPEESREALFDMRDVMFSEYPRNRSTPEPSKYFTESSYLVHEMCKAVEAIQGQLQATSIRKGEAKSGTDDVGDTGKSYGFGGRLQSYGGYATRKYYSENDEVLYEVKHDPNQESYFGDDISLTYAHINASISQTTEKLLEQANGMIEEAGEEEDTTYLETARDLFAQSVEQRPDSVEDYEPFAAILSERREIRASAVSVLAWEEYIRQFEYPIRNISSTNLPEQYGKIDSNFYGLTYDIPRLKEKVEACDTNCYRKGPVDAIEKNLESIKYEDDLREIAFALHDMAQKEREGHQFARRFIVRSPSGSTVSGYSVITPEGVPLDPDSIRSSRKEAEHDYKQITPGTLSAEYTLSRSRGQNPGISIELALDLRCGHVTPAQIEALVEHLYGEEHLQSRLEDVPKEKFAKALQPFATGESGSQNEEWDGSLSLFMPEGKREPIVDSFARTQAFRTITGDLPPLEEMLDVESIAAKSEALAVQGEEANQEASKPQEVEAEKQRKFIGKIMENADKPLDELVALFDNEADVTVSEAAYIAIALREPWRTTWEEVGVLRLDAGIGRVEKYLKSVGSDSYSEQTLQEILDEVEPLRDRLSLLDHVGETINEYVGEEDEDTIHKVEDALYAWLTSEDALPNFEQVQEKVTEFIDSATS